MLIMCPPHTVVIKEQGCFSGILLSLIVWLLLGAGFYWVSKCSRKRKTYARNCPVSLLPWVRTAAESCWEALAVLVKQLLVMFSKLHDISQLHPLCALSTFEPVCLMDLEHKCRAVSTEPLSPRHGSVTDSVSALTVSACPLPFLKHRLL